MSRPILRANSVATDAANAMAQFHADVVKSVANAVSTEKVVVVGMALNPHVLRAKQTLSKEGVPFKYLEFGSYVSGWKERLAIKLWSGWPTFPQVFVDGTLIGGANETARAVKAGLLKST